MENIYPLLTFWEDGFRTQRTRDAAPLCAFAVCLKLVDGVRHNIVYKMYHGWKYLILSTRTFIIIPREAIFNYVDVVKIAISKQPFSNLAFDWPIRNQKFAILYQQCKVITFKIPTNEDTFRSPVVSILRISAMMKTSDPPVPMPINYIKGRCQTSLKLSLYAPWGVPCHHPPSGSGKTVIISPGYAKTSVTRYASGILST